MLYPTHRLCSRRPPKRSHPQNAKQSPVLQYQSQEHKLSEPSPVSPTESSPTGRVSLHRFRSQGTPRRRWYFIGSSIILFGMGFYTTSLYTSYTRDPPPSSTSSSSSSTPSPSRQADFTRIYDTTASSYDSLVSTSEFLMGMSLLRRSLARRAQGDVLEASCGTGRNLKYVVWDRVRSLTCVDASREMVGVARDTAAQLEEVGWSGAQTGMRGRIRWVVGGLGRGVPRAPVEDRRNDDRGKGERSESEEREDSREKVEESEKMLVVRKNAKDEEGKYDTVIQSLGLCSTDQPVQLIRGLARATKSDGTIVLLEHGKSHYQWLNKILDRSASDHARIHGCWWNRDIGKIVEESELEVVKIWRCHLGTTWWIELKPPSRQLTDKWDRQEVKTKEVDNSNTMTSRRAKWWSWNR